MRSLGGAVNCLEWCIEGTAQEEEDKAQVREEHTVLISSVQFSSHETEQQSLK